MTDTKLLYSRRPLFIDDNLSPRYAIIFYKVFGHPTKTIKSVYGKKAKDPNFLPDLGQRDPKPILFSCDSKMRIDPEELDLLRTYRITYVMAKGNLQRERLHNQVWRVVRLWPRIMDQIDHDPDRVFLVDFHRNRIEAHPYY